MSDILNRFMDNTSEETAVDASKKVKVGIIGTGWIAEAHAVGRSPPAGDTALPCHTVPAPGIAPVACCCA